MPEKIVVSETIASQVTDRLREDIIHHRIAAGSSFHRGVIFPEFTHVPTR